MTLQPHPRSRQIAALNDLARQTFQGCRVMLTSGVQELDKQFDILQKVRGFDQFTEDNDPYGEHDFGGFEFEGSRIFWKFDYYDGNTEWGSPDPSDPEQTTRVLTIFLAEEY
jgi:hypothetical protein